MIRYAALLFAIVIVSLGVLGFVAPNAFLTAMGFFQTGHRIYIAALIRVLIGVIFFAAATDSRWPRAMRVVSSLVILLGLLTPVSTHPIPSVAWGWWPGDFVRPWAAATMSLAIFVIAAVVPPRDLDD